MPNSMKSAVKLFILATGLGLGLSACGAPPIQHGYVMADNALEQVPVGSSREQVLLVLGTPSTTSTLAGDTFYYISQTIDDNPLLGRDVTDQRVMAVYFDEKNTVKQIANYGLKDGHVFDFIERRTRTAGADLSLIGQMLGALGNQSPL